MSMLAMVSHGKGLLAVPIAGSIPLFMVGTALQLLATTCMGIFLATKVHHAAATGRGMVAERRIGHLIARVVVSKLTAVIRLSASSTTAMPRLKSKATMRLPGCFNLMLLSNIVVSTSLTVCPGWAARCSTSARFCG